MTSMLGVVTSTTEHISNHIIDSRRISDAAASKDSLLEKAERLESLVLICSLNVNTYITKRLEC